MDIWALDEVSRARVSNLSSMCQLKTLFGVILVVPRPRPRHRPTLYSYSLPLARGAQGGGGPTKGVGEAHTCAHAAEEGRIHRKMIIDAKVHSIIAMPSRRDGDSSHITAG